VSLLRALKREFGFYCIELVAEKPAEPVQPEMAYVTGGRGEIGNCLSSTERYDAVSGQRSSAAAMGTARSAFGVCVIAGEIYFTGGANSHYMRLPIVYKYSPLSNTSSAVASMPKPRYRHIVVAVGSAMYVLGGETEDEGSACDLHKFDSAQCT
jgi:hypothetical protein